jgi:hypothetical protein
MEEVNKYLAKSVLTNKQLKKREKYINSLALKDEIIINNKIIKTIGQLKKVVTSFDILDTLLYELADEDYVCIYRWLDNDDYKKKIKEYNDNKNKI